MQAPKSILDRVPKPVLKRVHMYLSHVSPESATGDIRPWGGYIHLKTEPASDEKIIWVAAGNTHPHQINALSLQLHGVGGQQGHDEEWQALTDISLLKGSSPVPYDARVSRPMLADFVRDDLFVHHMRSGQSIAIEAGTMHALLNPHMEEYAIVKEVRRSVGKDSDVDIRERDIVRILDHTRRDGAPSYADDSWNWILRSVRSTYQEFVSGEHLLMRHKLEADENTGQLVQ